MRKRKATFNRRTALRRHGALFLALVLFAVAFAGCFGGGDPQVEDEQVKLESIEREETETTAAPLTETETEPASTTTESGETEAHLGEPVTAEVPTPMGTGEPNVVAYRQIESVRYVDWLESAEVEDLRIRAKDDDYAARLKAEEEAAALAAQQAAYYANLQQQQVYVPPAQDQDPVGVQSKGAAGIHDTAAGAATIINMINNYRVSIGLNAMVNDATMQSISLQRVVQVGVSYRATGDSTGHTHFGMGALQWIAANYGVGYAQAENTGFFTTGTKTPEQIYTAFFNSHGHYVNMMNPAYTKVGVALYYDPVDNREYVVMNFGY